MTADTLRGRYIEFFARRGHTVVPSSSLVPAEDKTLLFTNAGMNQFKDVILGREPRSYRRAVSVQKCVRAGGKHNDLEQVGRTARHGTFFEMLGNWSFGDYFKREAIRYAWDFVTEELGFPRDRLWVTVFRDDDEAYALWQEEAGLPPERIVRLDEKDNFWEMADTGPCGPDTELFLDRGAEFACGPDCGIGRCECDRFQEFWNLVFIQFDRGQDGSLTPLRHPTVDTGMGLERVTAILNDKPSIFETDLFWPLIHRVEQMTGGRYEALPSVAGLPYRVIADHVRAVTMLLADGVLFSNEGRGYVLRRILRRAVRYGRVIGLHEPFLFQLVPVVGEILGEAYPEVLAGQGTIAATIRGEEERFHQTLESGLRLLGQMLGGLREGERLGGEAAFRLYDTHGFPIDITVDVARERGVQVDIDAFSALMAEQRARARRERPVRVRDLPSMPPSRFRGYETLEDEAPIDVLWRDGEPVEEAVAGDAVMVYLPTTPFYPEGGGQVGDRGRLVGPEGAMFVEDTQKESGAIWHFGRVEEGRLRRGDIVQAVVDQNLRAGAMRNHTGTHLLHAALSEVLGDGARQTGSLVAPDRLRFDFSHPEPLSPVELREVEDRVNQWILEDRPVQTVETSLMEARAAGAIAFFGDKYGERVRVVEVPGASKELCGGTHCRRTGQIGLFRIVEETSIGSGTRRLEAVTGLGSLEWSRTQEALLEETAATLRTTRQSLGDRARDVMETVRELERRVREAERAALQQAAAELLKVAEDVAGLRVVRAEVRERTPEEVRLLVDHLRERVDVAVVASIVGDRVNLTVLAGPRAQRLGLKAGELVRELAPLVEGGGGGRADLAQAGGKNAAGAARALAAARTAVEKRALQDIPS